MKRKKRNYTIVYRLKWTAWEYRVAIAAVNDYRLKLKEQGLDRTAVNHLLLKLIDAYES